MAGRVGTQVLPADGAPPAAGTDGIELLGDVPSYRSDELSPGRRVSVSLLDRPVLVASSAH